MEVQIANPKVKRQMKAEDEFLRYLRDWVRVERDKANKEKDKIIKEQAAKIAELEKLIQITK